MPTEHISQSWLINNLIKAVDKNKEAFENLKRKLRCISKTKLEEGVCGGFQITEIFKDHFFKACR